MNYPLEYKYKLKGRLHQSTRKGHHGRKVSVIIATELQPLIEELADEERFSISLTVNTLLAIQLGAKLREATHRKNQARDSKNAQKRRNARKKGEALRLVSSM